MTATIQLCCAADTILCCNVSLEIEDRKERVMNTYEKGAASCMMAQLRGYIQCYGGGG